MRPDTSRLLFLFLFFHPASPRCTDPADVEHGSWNCKWDACYLTCDHGYITSDKVAFACDTNDATQSARCVETAAIVIGKEKCIMNTTHDNVFALLQGGEKLSGVLSSVEILSSNQDLSEKAIKDYPHPVTAAIAFWHEGEVYACGGENMRKKGFLYIKNTCSLRS
jgi:hypothetical protein